MIVVLKPITIFISKNKSLWKKGKPNSNTKIQNKSNVTLNVFKFLLTPAVICKHLLLHEKEIVQNL